MSEQVIYQIIGYTGSAFCLAAMTMTSVLRLRIINSIGAICTLIYGLLIHAYPMVLTNGSILLINIYFIHKVLAHNTKHYSTFSCDLNDKSLRYFLDKHAKDIALYFPEFKFRPSKQNYAKFTLCQDTLVGLLIGTRHQDSLRVELDYSIPQYRDCSVGRNIYATMPKDGISEVHFNGQQEKSEDYLQKVGFQHRGNAYTKQLHCQGAMA